MCEHCNIVKCPILNKTECPLNKLEIALISKQSALLNLIDALLDTPAYVFKWEDILPPPKYY